MSQSAALHSLSLLKIAKADGGFCYGPNQEWYQHIWQRKAGCGPTTCSQLIWYLSRTRAGYQGLCPHDGSTQAGFLQLMEEVWDYVTPGRHGVNTTGILTEGALGYGRERHLELGCQVLEIPEAPGERPTSEVMADFILGALEQDRPVAFLNLSNGMVQNLDAWHWVTLVAFSRESFLAEMYDNEERDQIDLEMWLRTTTGGGGFVALDIA